MQLTIDRPRIVRFEDEGGILPIHWVGVTGHLRPFVEGDRQVELSGGVGNGHGDIVDNILTEGDNNSFKSILGKVELKGFGARDLRLGLSGVYDQIRALPATDAMGGPTRPALPDTFIREIIANAYLVYRGPDLTLISEVYEVLHTASGPIGGHWSTVDAYALGGYRFGELVPYVMGEIRRTPTGVPDPFFFPDPSLPLDPTGILRDFVEITAGLRWDLTHLERDQARVPGHDRRRFGRPRPPRHGRLELRPLAPVEDGRAWSGRARARCARFSRRRPVVRLPSA